MTKSRTAGTDTWLTPPALVEALGPFDLDPCCPKRMPWATAITMFALPKYDGLVQAWHGTVWLNPPYSDVGPWALRMIDHNNGFMLVNAAATGTRWCQAALAKCDVALFMAGRLKFHHPDGRESDGKWLSNLLLAFGTHCGSRLMFATKQEHWAWPGVVVYPRRK